VLSQTWANPGPIRRPEHAARRSACRLRGRPHRGAHARSGAARARRPSARAAPPPRAPRALPRGRASRRRGGSRAGAVGGHGRERSAAEVREDELALRRAAARHAVPEHARGVLRWQRHVPAARARLRHEHRIGAVRGPHAIEAAPHAHRAGVQVEALTVRYRVAATKRERDAVALDFRDAVASLARERGPVRLELDLTPR